MAARAIWKGVLELGSHKVAVKLYSAVEEHGVHFRLLESEKKHVPVHQQLVDPNTDEVVPYADVQRGYALDHGFVILHKGELEQLAPEPSREIAISQFVATQKLGPEWLIRPYYLGPDGDDESYFALAEALAEEDKEGIAHWVMRGQEYSGVLRSLDGYLALITLRHADEIIEESMLPRPQGRAHSDKELKMAEQLIAAYEDAFDPSQYKDEYRERVLEFVEAKAQGKRPRLKKPVVKHEEADLTSALAKSLAGLKKTSASKAAPRKEKHVA
jgi:DNA end-binding protein Ku